MPTLMKLDGQQLLSRLKRAWKVYASKIRCCDWRDKQGMSFINSLQQWDPDYDPIGSRAQFSRYVYKLIGLEACIEWQPNGDCIVQGVIYLELNPKEK